MRVLFYGLWFWSGCYHEIEILYLQVLCRRGRAGDCLTARLNSQTGTRMLPGADPKLVQNGFIQKLLLHPIQELLQLGTCYHTHVTEEVRCFLQFRFSD